MSGLFVAIVGPSGAGKDALIRALQLRRAGDADFATVRRVVTRDADAYEDHLSLDPEAFEARHRAGGFALTWEAHGLRYGVPAAVDDGFAAGKTLICNLSRGAVAAARRRWRHVFCVLVTARPETLAARLAARGREPEAGQRARLARAADFIQDHDAVVENDGELAVAVDRLYRLIEARKGLA